MFWFCFFRNVEFRLLLWCSMNEDPPRFVLFIMPLIFYNNIRFCLSISVNLISFWYYFFILFMLMSKPYNGRVIGFVFFKFYKWYYIDLSCSFFFTNLFTYAVSFCINFINIICKTNLIYVMVLKYNFYLFIIFYN